LAISGGKIRQSGGPSGQRLAPPLFVCFFYRGSLPDVGVSDLAYRRIPRMGAGASPATSDPRIRPGSFGASVPFTPRRPCPSGSKRCGFRGTKPSVGKPYPQEVTWLCRCPPTKEGRSAVRGRRRRRKPRKIGRDVRTEKFTEVRIVRSPKDPRQVTKVTIVRRRNGDVTVETYEL
jgi:hypothetical protein